MAITGSPNIIVQETDLSTYVNADSVTAAALVGEYNWGPCFESTLIQSMGELVNTFGKPDDLTYIDFYTAKNYLSYSSNLNIVRVIENGTKQAYRSLDSDTYTWEDFIYSYSRFEKKQDLLKHQLTARYPGVLGNYIVIAMLDKNGLAKRKEETDICTNYLYDLVKNHNFAEEEIAIAVWSVDQAALKKSGLDILDYCNKIDPVEFAYYSTNTEGVDITGYPNYIFTVFNTNSKYAYLTKSMFNGKNTSKKWYYDLTSDEHRVDFMACLVGGATVCDDPRFASSWTNTAEELDKNKLSVYEQGWDLFSNEETEDEDVNLLLQGSGNIDVGNYMIESIAENRKDCVACVSPMYWEVITQQDNIDIVNNIINGSGKQYANSSYCFMDGNYKYQWDSYGNTYRWMPLNGDIGGLFAYIDENENPWMSIGNRTITNCTKLAFTPNKAERDTLFEYLVNPVTNFKGSGNVIWGDWTRLDSSSFNFIGIRRCFLYMERAIKQTARTIMFQQNDSITASSFTQMVTPFLEEIQGARGIQEFSLKAGSEVTTADEMDRGIFRASIIIKPVRSIRYVVLNFTSIRSDISIDEVE